MNPAALDLGLADFALGHETDPLQAPCGFEAWKTETAEYQALFERRLLSPAGPRGSVRGPEGPLPVVNVASLDYLGLCRHPDIAEAQKAALDTWGSGAAGVPLLSGMTEIHETLERRLQAITGFPGVILFTSGFSAAIACASAFFHRGDVVILDERAHMSWVDGVKMSGARLVTFAHNDPQDLQAVLRRYQSARRAVILDGLYSMDGNLADLGPIVAVAEAEKVGVIVDEAHSIFACGQRGGGVTNMSAGSKVRAMLGTFSKALGQVGGFIAGPADLIDYLRYYGHPYVFSAALPPAVVAGVLAGLDILQAEPQRRVRLAANAGYFRSQLRELGFNIGRSESWVVPIILGSQRGLLYEATRELMLRGLYVAPVDFPAVAEDQVRLRCAISADHTRQDLDFALNLLAEVIEPDQRQPGHP